MITERHIQAIWYDRAFRPAHLVAVGRSPGTGGEVRVIDPGAWNLGPGPDFRNAVLEIGPARRRLVGDVEVHRAPSDWDAHGHGGDPAYANVIAHVTWSCGPPPASLPRQAVTIWIGRHLTADVGFAPEAIDLSAYPFARLPAAERPCLVALDRDPDRALALISEAGRRRLAEKAERLRQRMAAACDREQLFYAEVMAALGYSRNARAFRAVADAVPYRQLLAEPENAALGLVSAASFAGALRGGIRPCNAPETRLRAAAAVFLSTSVMALADASDFDVADCRAMASALAGPHLVGRGRCAAILANVVVPWAIAEGRLAEPPAWLPPEDISEPVRLTAFRLFGRDHNPRALYAGNGLLIQGLIDVYRRHCLPIHPDCGQCGFAGGMGLSDAPK